MLKKENFTAAHVDEIRAAKGGDPLLIERTVFAFGLLEALVRVGLKFVFKGGTSLMLLLKKPRRLSTDIDIIVDPDTDIDAALDAAAKIFPFISREEQVRVGKNNIVKRHFKFVYESPKMGRQSYILLDVLFESDHYAHKDTRKIENEILLTDEPPSEVFLPDVDSVLGDKLTAFAPHTIGILFGQDKEMEIAKQMYDVCTLLDEVKDFARVRETYVAVARSEAAYRGLAFDIDSFLTDTYNAAACIASRGRLFPEDFPLLMKGIRDVKNHVFGERYNAEIAAIRAVKVMFAAKCLMLNHDYADVLDLEVAQSADLSPELRPMKYIRSQDKTAWAMLVTMCQMSFKTEK